MLAKPQEIFDRDPEWHALSSFVSSKAGLPLGVVYGRRRQGKTWLLDGLARQTGGFTFTAAQHEAAVRAAQRFGRELGEALGLPAFEFADWDAAGAALFDLLRDGRLPLVILDEISYLIAAVPELPSVIQRHLDRTRGLRPRLVLCGSAFSIMSSLLTGDAPLRGRAQLDLRIMPFDYRTAADFWGLGAMPELALAVHSVVGGTPAYRELAGGVPSSLDGFPAWVEQAVLDPSRALFSEGILLLSQEQGLERRGPYVELLAAISAGSTRHAQIAERVQRTAAAVSPLLNVLESLALIEKLPDPLRAKRFTYRVTEPILQFHHAVIDRPAFRRGFERRDRDAWRQARETFRTHVLGPHFEHLARVWTKQHATAETLGGIPSQVGRSSVADPASRQSLELDVVAVGSAGGDPNGKGLLAIGEAKASTRPVARTHLDALERRRELLGAAGVAGAERARLLLFGLSGFTQGLRRVAAGRRDVVLVDPERMYGGE